MNLLEKIKADREDLAKPFAGMLDLPCEKCGDDGVIEILGDGDNFECDVIGYKNCPVCNNND